MMKISSTYADMFKDTFLTVSLMIITGGLRNVLLYPTQFTSVIVLGLSASIIVPIFLSSVNLALSNPFLIFSSLNLHQGRRSVAILSCVACSVLTPILLIVSYQHGKERMRIMLRNNSRDRRVPGIMKKCMALKNELSEHLQIELGKIRLCKDTGLYLPFSGMEVFLQLSLQIIVLLLNKTDTATTSGLQTFFQKTSILGVDSTIVLRKAFISTTTLFYNCC